MDSKTNANLPVKCPSCNSGLTVKSLSCNNCETVVSGSFKLPVILLLENKDLEFVLSFVKNSGSLKEMAKEMKLSYPSVRNYLNDLIEKINNLENNFNNEQK